MPGLHARNSPSSASRWMRCPGSIAFCDVVEETSQWAAEGTCAHGILEKCLRDGVEAETFIGQPLESDGYTFTFTRKDSDLIQNSVDEILEYGGKLYPEQRVYFDRWGVRRDHQFGTLDVGIITKNRVIVRDFKWGQGVPVDVEDNEQVLIYLLAFWDNVVRHVSDVEDFEIQIDQPRVKGGGGRQRVNLKQLLRFGDKVKKAVLRTYEPDAPLVPGVKQCLFCPKRGRCPALAEFCLGVLNLKFKDLDRAANFDVNLPLTKAKDLTLKQRCQIVKCESLIRKWLTDIYTDMLGEALMGRPTPGLVAVYGRKGPRSWKRPGVVAALAEGSIGDEAYARELKSPAQLEQDMPAADFKRLKKFIGQTDGKPVLVSDDSKSERVATVRSKFKNLNKED